MHEGDFWDFRSLTQPTQYALSELSASGPQWKKALSGSAVNLFNNTPLRLCQEPKCFPLASLSVIPPSPVTVAMSAGNKCSCLLWVPLEVKYASQYIQSSKDAKRLLNKRQCYVFFFLYSLLCLWLSVPLIHWLLPFIMCLPEWLLSPLFEPPRKQVTMDGRHPSSQGWKEGQADLRLKPSICLTWLTSFHVATQRELIQGWKIFCQVRLQSDFHTKSLQSSLKNRHKSWQKEKDWAHCDV